MRNRDELSDYHPDDNIEEESSTRSASSYEHLQGINLNDLIERVTVNNVLLSYPGTQTAYHSCHLIQCYNSLNCSFSCIKKYENTTTTTFLDEDDYNQYVTDIHLRSYIIQGLTVDKDNNFLITLYYMGHSTTDDYMYDKNSIMIRYNPSTSEIIKIYDLNNTSHVGGIGYYHTTVNSVMFGTTSIEMFFIRGASLAEGGNGANTIDLFYEVDSNRDLYKKTYHFIIDHKASSISISNNYLWTSEFEEDVADKKFTGYKVNVDVLSSFTGRWEVQLGESTDRTLPAIPNFDLIIPIANVQGMYCDSDPETSNKLNFYIAISDSADTIGSLYDGDYTIYQATMSFNDKNSDETVGDGTLSSNEYYWESIYSPYSHSNTYTKVPAGLEGIVKLSNGELWVANEGSSYHYCEKWDAWGENNIDCANEIMRVDPIIKNFVDTEIFPSGSIDLLGVSLLGDLDDFGRKLIMVFAKNKNGEFYYSIGKLSYNVALNTSNQIYEKMSIFLEEPNTTLPVGYQLPSLSTKVRVFMEDIKGVYVLNLPDSSSTTNTDDWYLYKVRLNYDENTQIEQAAVMIYDEEYYLSTTLGDNSSDYDAVMFAFDTRWGTNKTANIKRVNNETSSNMHGELYYLYAETRACYNSTGSTDTICINNLKNKFEQYLECSYDSDFYFRDYMNSSSLDRLNDIQFDCN